MYNHTDYIGVFTSHQKYCLFFHLILKGLILLWKKLWNSTILTLSLLMSHRIQAWSKMSTFFKWTNQDQTCDQSCKMLCADITEKLSYTDKLDIVGIAIHQNKLIWGKGYPSLPILQFLTLFKMPLTAPLPLPSPLPFEHLVENFRPLRGVLLGYHKFCSSFWTWVWPPPPPFERC